MAKTKKLDKCPTCGVLTKLTRGHIVPLARGGVDNPVNIRYICRACNEEKADSMGWIPPIRRRIYWDN